MCQGKNLYRPPMIDDKAALIIGTERIQLCIEEFILTSAKEITYTLTALSLIRVVGNKQLRQDNRKKFQKRTIDLPLSSL